MPDESRCNYKRLNIGCGAFKLDGYINLGIDACVDPDILHDCNIFSYPFEDGQFDVIFSNHNIEHLEVPLFAMKEMHRLLRQGGQLTLRVPHFSRGFTHPDHKRGFDVSFPYYYNVGFSGGYSGTPFIIESLRMRWNGETYLKKQVLSQPISLGLATMGSLFDLFANLSPAFCSRVWCFWVGGFDELEFVFRKPCT